MSTCHTPEPGPKPAPLSGQLASTMPNMIISLALICALMAATLAGIYLMTKPRIAQIAIEREEAAVKAVLPEYDNNPAKEVRWFDKDGAPLDAANPDNDARALVRLYPASKGGQAVGYAIKSFTDKGYGRRIILMAGFLPDGTIRDLRVMDQGETPGLGTKMTEPEFQSQFLNKNPASFKLSVKKDGGDVDAITAATISSRAVCDALGRAYKTLGEVKK